MSEVPVGAECLISIVIPAYNAAIFIDRTLESAVAQTHRNTEILVIDDGSTDATASKIDAWAARDARIRRISMPNGGVARARNRGLDEASADFVAFLDADDLWHVDKLKLQLACMLNSPIRLGGCYGLTRSINADDCVIGDGPRLVADGFVLARHISTHLVRNGSCLMVRRDVALAIGGFDASYAERGIGGCEDLDFELKLAAKHPVGAVPYYIVGYRQYPGNMSSNRVRMANAMRATVSAHLTANHNLPAKVRRHAWARVYEYHIWNNIREKRVLTSAFTILRLAAIDTARATRVVRPLVVRSAVYFGLVPIPIKQPELALPRFQDMTLAPLGGKSARHVDIDILDSLAEIDAALWRDLQSRQRQGSALIGNPDELLTVSV